MVLARLVAPVLLAAGCAEPPPAATPGTDDQPSAAATAPAIPPTAPGEVAQGIDVSHHQGEVHWPSVARAGVHFVYVKATEGVDYVDPRFFANWRAARAAGLPVGAYHLYRPEDEAEPQVANFVRALEAVEFGSADLPPVLDIEKVSSTGRVPRDELHDRAVAMLAGIHRETGARPLVYTNPSFWRDYLTGDHDLTRYPLWIAEYRDGVDRPDDPPGWSSWTMWQFSEEGAVEGVAKPVDRSRFNGGGAELEAFVRASHGAPAPD